MGRPKVGEILIRAGLIDEMQLRAALGDQRNWGHPLGMTLVKMGVIEERDLVRALAAQLQLPVVVLDGKRVQPEVLELVPAEFAERHLCVPLFVREKGGIETLHLGMEDPCNVQVIDDLSFRTGMKVQPVLVSPSELCEAIDRFYGRGDVESGDPVSRPASPGVEASPTVHESLFPTISPGASLTSSPKSNGDSGTLELDEEAPQQRAPASADAGGEDTNRTILRALCHLLIEKGVIERQELQDVVASLRDAES